VVPEGVERAPFVTFEGGEGTGKSTQLRLLAARLRERGLDPLETREPGGTPGAEAVRRLLLEGSADRWLPLSELYLVLAARADHVARVVAPARAAGRWVLCDRFVDSTRVYQGLAGGLAIELVDRLQEPAVAGHWPDLTILLDLPVDKGLARRDRAGERGRFEDKERSFHERVRTGFLELAASEPGRFAVFPADAPPQQLAARIWEEVCRRFGIVPA
jgi:dTMP kinase